MNEPDDYDRAFDQALSAFTRETGLATANAKKEYIGNKQFIKFTVGRQSPLYTYALHAAQRNLPEANPYRGALSLELQAAENFPSSIEAEALLALLARSTRVISQDSSERGYAVPYIPFQNREDYQLSQPATHIVKGRRGVGKSTLILRAVENLQSTKSVIAVLDMQAYSTLNGNELLREVLHDICVALAASSKHIPQVEVDTTMMRNGAEDILSGTLALERAPVAIKRALTSITRTTNGHAFVFLDDFHLIPHDEQPQLIHTIHGALKGANGWLKVAGLSSLLNLYSPTSQKGLQVPGDAQVITLDLTLANPEAAESHLRAILESFLKSVGYNFNGTVLSNDTFRRLVWATAGVPRDFLQMFAKATTHARRNKHSVVTLSDVNIAIGEFGQQKMEDLSRDARNTADALLKAITRLEELCLDGIDKVNAFLVRSDNSDERSLVHALSDLRMVHLIHPSITPDKAGERYEAYIIDYSIFTGFRRRPGEREMVPTVGQFKAADLRALPKFE